MVKIEKWKIFSCTVGGLQRRSGENPIFFFLQNYEKMRILQRTKVVNRHENYEIEKNWVENRVFSKTQKKNENFFSFFFEKI